MYCAELRAAEKRVSWKREKKVRRKGRQAGTVRNAISMRKTGREEGT